MSKKEVIALVLVLALGIGLRSVEVLNKNFLFGFDQGRDFLAARKIIVDRKLTLIGAEVGSGFAGISGLFHGPYYYYFLATVFLLFGGNPYGGMVAMFVLGILSLALVFGIVRELLGVRAGLAATFLAGVSPALTAQSRFIWSPHPTPVFILIAFWLTFKIARKPRRYFFWATFVAGLIYGFEMAISVPLIVAQFVFVLFVLKIKDLRTYLGGVGGVVSSHLPLLLFELRHNFMATRGLARFFGKIFQGGEGIDKKLFFNHLVDFWNNFYSTFLLTGWWKPFSFLIFLSGIGIYCWRREKIGDKKHFLAFLLLLPPVSFGVFMFLKGPVRGFYLVHLYFAYIFLVAFLWGKREFSGQAVIGLFLVLMLPGVGREIKRAWVDFYDYGGTHKTKGKLDAIDFIYQDAQGEKFSVFVFTPPIYDYAYRYLLIWYGEKKYGYLPGDEKEGLFYFWIEPDPSKPWTYQGWLETVIKTGEVLKETRLPSGFIIQKRHG